MRTTRVLVALLLALLGVWWWALDRRPVQASAPRGGWRVSVPREHGGWIEGHLTLDEGVEPSALELQLDLGDGLRNLVGEPDADGRFLIGELHPGRARLAVVLRASGVPLAVLDDLAVPTDGPCRDARLVPIDLRGRVHCVALELLDHEGRPVERATVGWRSAAAEGDGLPYERWVVARDGVLELVSDREALDLLVLAPGAETTELYGVMGRRAVHLREGWVVRLGLPEGLDPLADGVELAARLRPATTDPRIDRATSLGGRTDGRPLEVVFAGPEAEVVVPRLGVYRLEWRAARRVPDGLEPLELGREPVELAVGPEAYRSVARPAFPIGAYRAALAR